MNLCHPVGFCLFFGLVPFVCLVWFGVAMSLSRKPFCSLAIQMGTNEGTHYQVLYQTDPGRPEVSP